MISRLGGVNAQLRRVRVEEEVGVRLSMRCKAVERGGFVEVYGQLRREALVSDSAGRGVAVPHFPHALGNIERRRLHFRDECLGKEQRDTFPLGKIARQQDLVPAAQNETKLRPARPRIFASQRVVGVHEVLYEPVAETAKERKAAHHFVFDQRSADGSISAERVVVAGADPRARLEAVRGLARDDVDGAADGVATVEGSLRSAENFDALDVEKIHEGHGGPSEVDPVEMDRGTLIAAAGASRGPDAANFHLRLMGALGDCHRWQEPGEIEQFICAHLVECSSRERRDRQGCGLDIGGSGLRRGHGDPLGVRRQGQLDILRRSARADDDVDASRFEALGYCRDHIFAGRQAVECVPALVVRHDGARSGKSVAGNGH